MMARIFGGLGERWPVAPAALWGRVAASFMALGCLTAVCSIALATEPSADESLRTALRKELVRSQEKLQLPGEARPHYIAFQVTDSKSVHLTASLGELSLAQRVETRNLFANVRVGDEKLDSALPGMRGGQYRLPTDDDPLALRHALWRASDAEYKAAVEALAQKKTMARTRVVEKEEEVPDFAPEPVHETLRPAPELRAEDAERRLREIVTRLSAVAKSYPDLRSSGADASVQRVRHRLLTSEGTWVDEAGLYTRVGVDVEAQAADGMKLNLGFSVTSHAVEQLPAVEALETQARDSIERLLASARAPLPENGSAVVLFEGAAATQLIQALLVERLDGTPPQKFVPVDSDASLAPKLGLPVVANLVDVYDDPTVVEGPGGVRLWGHYAADDEGVPARKVSLIERGVLKTLLMSRAPRKEIRESNGHARGGYGVGIGNLFVTGKVRTARARLLAVARDKARPEKATVYIVKRLGSQYPQPGGSFGLTMARMMGFEPPLFAAGGLLATEAYRVVDGKEEPVRGLILEHLDLRTLKDIVAIGDQPHVYNGGQGTARFSIVSPALLITDIDVKKFSGSNPKLPSYPRAAP